MSSAPSFRNVAIHPLCYLLLMEVEPEDIPMQMLEFLGNMAMDYGDQNGPATKKRKDLQSKTSLPDSESKAAGMTKMMTLMATLLLRHERDLMALQSQNSYVLFLSTVKEGMIAPLLHESANWKKAQQQHQVTMPLRQHLFQFLLETLIQRVFKVKDCKKEDPLWKSSLQSQLVLQDGSWPFHVWNHGNKRLELDAKTPSIPMEEMFMTLEQL